MTAILVRHRNPTLRAIQWIDSNEAEIRALVTNFEALDDADRANSDDPEATAQVAVPPHYSWTLVYTGDWFVEYGETWRRLNDDAFREEFEVAAWVA